MMTLTRKTNLKFLAYSLVAISSLPAANAAIALDRTRVIITSEDKSVSLTISNQNKQLPYLAQSWLEDDKGNKIQSPFSVLPPLQRVEPDKSSQIRIQSLPATAKLPQDRESIFYFNVREIPPRSSKPNTLQLALQTRIKMFYRPAAIIPDNTSAPWAEQITLRRTGSQYVVVNPTPFYVTLIDVRAGKNSPSIDSFNPLMIAPKSSSEINIPASSVGSSPVITYVNDYGGRPKLSFACSGDECRVIPAKKGSE